MQTRQILVLASDAVVREFLAGDERGDGGAQRLRKNFVRALCAEMGAAEISIVTAREYAGPLSELPILKNTKVHTFEHWISERGRNAEVLVHCIDASIAKASRLSRAASGGRWGVTGMTHDVFDAEFAQDLNLAAAEGLPPVAIACASAASRSAVQGLRRTMVGPPRVALPIISHGVSIRPPRPGQRTAARERFGWTDRTTAILYLGRLSFHAKADIIGLVDACSKPVPLENIELVLAGAGSSDIASIRTYADLAQEKGLAVRVLSDVCDAEKECLLAGADIFVSPSNSVQESFGLALVEAMAAGLPVVASDWSAYRELIKPGISGMLVPTSATRRLMNVAGRLRGLESSATVHAYASASVEIDTATLRECLRSLVGSPDARQQLGAAGANAAANLSMERMVRRYLRLWSLMPVGTKAAPADNVASAFYRFPTRWVD